MRTGWKDKNDTNADGDYAEEGRLVATTMRRKGQKKKRKKTRAEGG
jgi:hypothetical protein